MRSKWRWPIADGLSYLELLIGLSIVAVVMPSAFRLAVSVISRASRIPPATRHSTMETLARDIRCAVDNPALDPFHFHDGTLVFARSTVAGAVVVRHEGVDARFFDGDRWSGDWGWDAFHRRATRGVRGLPVAVEIRAEGEVRWVPTMTTAINRWRDDVSAAPRPSPL